MSEIYKKLANIMADVPAIPKNQKNSGQGFMFRGIDDFYNVMHPMLVKHHIFCAPEVVKSEYKEATTARGGRVTYAMVTMKYTYFAEDGSHVSCSACAEAMDSGDKATSKAMAIAHKYALMQMFCVPVEELSTMDPDHYDYEIKNISPMPAQITFDEPTLLMTAEAKLRGSTNYEDALKVYSEVVKSNPDPAFRRDVKALGAKITAERGW
jgi:ERF superfamily protein